MATRTLSLADIRSHNTKDDCWIVVNSKIWDVTDFLDKHPGGSGSEYARALYRRC